MLATKVFYPMGPGPNDRGLSRAHIMSAIDASLRRLGTEYVDLYQIHRWDPETPIEETMTAVRAVAGERGVPPARIALAWLLDKAAVTAPIVGTTKSHHVDDAVGALEIRLSEDEVARLETPYRPHPVLWS